MSASGQQELQPCFCPECGAANAWQATRCCACHRPLARQAPLRGRYRPVREIGRGGFGVVYLARDLRHWRLVAVKQITLGGLSARQSIEATASYNREVALLGRLNHRRLPRLYDHFTDHEHWYLVMRYLAGQTLDVLAQAQPGQVFPLKRVIRIGLQLCAILHYLHTRTPPIIFRDVKPANILQDARGRIYLLDFGIARRFQPGLARDTGPLGSPGYAAPEQYGRAQTTIHTDIYGLGATLQTLATGKEPTEIQADELAQGTPLQQGFARLLAQMLAREREQRPQSIQEVMAGLEALRWGRPERVYRLLPGLLVGLAPCTVFLLPDALTLTPGPVYTLLLLLLGCSWPLLLLGLLVVAIIQYCTPRKRLTGLGMLIGLAVFVVGLFFSGLFFHSFWL